MEITVPSPNGSSKGYDKANCPAFVNARLNLQVAVHDMVRKYRKTLIKDEYVYSTLS